MPAAGFGVLRGLRGFARADVLAIANAPINTASTGPAIATVLVMGAALMISASELANLNSYFLIN